jgi:hypothetical protein
MSDLSSSAPHTYLTSRILENIRDSATTKFTDEIKYQTRARFTALIRAPTCKRGAYWSAHGKAVLAGFRRGTKQAIACLVLVFRGLVHHSAPALGAGRLIREIDDPLTRTVDLGFVTKIDEVDGSTSPTLSRDWSGCSSGLDRSTSPIPSRGRNRSGLDRSTSPILRRNRDGGRLHRSTSPILSRNRCRARTTSVIQGHKSFRSRRGPARQAYVSTVSSRNRDGQQPTCDDSGLIRVTTGIRLRISFHRRALYKYRQFHLHSVLNIF